MVPEGGNFSNPSGDLLEEWNRTCQGKIEQPLEQPLELPESPKLEQLFDTLAEWNTYLENHVPYFSERRAEPGEIEP